MRRMQDGQNERPVETIALTFDKQLAATAALNLAADRLDERIRVRRRA
jgi:hypothetical protein